MVTRIHGHGPKTLYLREHRKAKGVSAVDMANRLGIERESVYRIEREERANKKRQAQWAAALDIEPEELWRLPGSRPSLDAMISKAPPDVQEMAVDIVRRLVAGRRS